MLFNIEKSYYQRSVKIFIFMLVVTIFTAIATWLINLDLISNINKLDSEVPSDVKEVEGWGKVTEYFLNNGLRVPLQMLLFSLLPIPFLYLLNLLVTSVLFGIVIAVALKVGLYEGLAMIVSSIPHFILEISAYCLIAATLYKLNKALYRPIVNYFRKNKKSKDSGIFSALRNTIKIYFLLAFPLIILAAISESYLADFIYKSLIH